MVAERRTHRRHPRRPTPNDRDQPVTAGAPAFQVALWRRTGDGWLAQFTGSFVANTVGVTASTVLANELHRRHTFRAADRVHWFAAQWEAGSLALVGLLLSSLALALLHLFVPAATGMTQALLVIAPSAVIGGLRFLALRGWVFAPAGKRRDMVR